MESVRECKSMRVCVWRQFHGEKKKKDNQKNNSINTKSRVKSSHQTDRPRI